MTGAVVGRPPPLPATGDQAFGLVEVVERQMCPDKTTVGGCVLCVFTKDRREGFGGIGHRALSQHLLGRFQSLGQAAITRKEADIAALKREMAKLPN